MGKAKPQPKHRAAHRHNAVAKPAKQKASGGGGGGAGKHHRKLEEMTVDEFLAHGLSSSAGSSSDEDGAPPVPAKKAAVAKGSKGAGPAEKPKKPQPKARSMKDAPAADEDSEEEEEESDIEDEEQMARDMEQLKYTDPEFYEFLKKDEPNLLDFRPSELGDESEDENDMSEDEDAEGSEEEEEEEVSGSDAGEEGEEEGSDMDEDASEDEEEEDEFGLEGMKSQRVVTKEMVQDLEKRVFEKHSLEALKQLLEAFRCAVHMSDEPSESENAPKSKHGKKNATEQDARFRKYRFDSSAAFNALVVLCLRRMQEALDYHLKMPAPAPGKKPIAASRSPQWGKHKNIVRAYIANLLHFTRQLVEPSMLGFVLKSVERMAPYYAAFPKIGRSLLKTCVDIWGKGEEHTRVMAFIVVRRLALTSPKAFLDVAVRALYMMYIKNAKFTTAQSQPMLAFMENCVVEICGIDPLVTYNQAFTYIRQLAIHLRAAMTTKKKDAYASVYNWQFLHCLQVWCRVVSEHRCPTLQPLTYPLAQVLLGTIRLVPTARYFPLRFHCVRALNMLSRSTRMFVPVAPLLLEVLDSQHVKGAPKKGVTKPPLFPYIYKVSKSLLGTKGFQEGCVDIVTGLLLEHMAIFSTHIAFPEYAVPTVVQLRKFLGNCRNAKIKTQLKQILDKTKENIRYIIARRREVTFAPKDAKAVVEWNRRTAEEAKSPLVLYSESWAKIEKARQAAFEATRAAQMDESEEEESESGSEDEAEIEGEEGDEDELSDLEPEERPQKKADKKQQQQPKKQAKAKAENKKVFNSDDEDADDIVGDLDLDDF